MTRQNSNQGLLSKQQAPLHKGEMFFTTEGRESIQELVGDNWLQGRWTKDHKKRTLAKDAFVFETLSDTPLLEEVRGYYIVVPGTSCYHSLVMGVRARACFPSHRCVHLG